MQRAAGRSDEAKNIDCRQSPEMVTPPADVGALASKCELHRHPPQGSKIRQPLGPPTFTAMSKFGILAACFLCNGASDAFRIVRLHPVRIAYQARLREGLVAVCSVCFSSPLPPLIGNLRPVWRASPAFLRLG
jgi:hypothetical protein